MAKVLILAGDAAESLELDADEEAGILKGLSEFEAGKGIPVRKVRAKLRRRR